MFHFFQDVWNQEFMRRALVGGALIGFTNGFLGAFIVLRRMSLMADALSHSMLPGLAIGLMVCGGLNAAGLFIGGITAAFFVALGAMAVLLACVGIYSVVAFSVARRRNEMGVRMALGATAPQVVRLVVSEMVHARFDAKRSAAPRESGSSLPTTSGS